MGWLYWYFWVIVVGFEAVAGGKVLNYWFHAPLWLLSLCLMVLMTATNLFSVSSFGEFEFWFAGIKVATIVLFLGIGALFVLGLLPGHHGDLSNLTGHGGFFPKGVGAVFAAIVVVIFSMVGAEIVTVAAAESRDPVQAVQRATRSVVARIAIFFVGSVFLLVVILPWNSVELGASPYVAALKHMGLPGADQAMNAVVLTAVLSCLNSGLYTASRMLFVLADRDEAPARLVKLSRRGVPDCRHPVLVGDRFLCVDHVVACAADGVPLPAQLVGRHHPVRLLADRAVADRAAPPHTRRAAGLKMWFFPVLSILTLVGITAVLVQMAFDRSARSQLWLSLLSWAVVIGLYFVGRAAAAAVRTSWRTAPPARTAACRTPPPTAAHVLSRLVPGDDLWVEAAEHVSSGSRRAFGRLPFEQAVLFTKTS